MKYRCRRCSHVHATESECVEHLVTQHGEDERKLRRNDWFRKTLIERCAPGAIDADEPLPLELSHGGTP